MSVFDQNFCEHLEYHLSATLRNTSNDKFNILWCDGVYIPNDLSQLEKQNIIHHKRIITKAHIGYDGQDMYEMTILLGPKALDAYLNDIILTDCLGEAGSNDWISLKMESKTIEIQLS